MRTLDYQQRVLEALDRYLDELKVRKADTDKAEAFVRANPGLTLEIPDFTKRTWEVLKAQERRLRLQKMKNEVVDRSRATALVFRLAREERDTWVNWPARIAALMAAELGVEAHPMQKVLETHVRAHLAELAELRPEFR